MNVSAVMPVCNGERYVAEAVASVFAQSRVPDEFIAVDDGSTDSSAAILARYPGIRLVSQANAGCASARNRGVAAATGDVIAFIDQDDLWTPEHLARMLAVLEGDARVAFVASALCNFLSPEMTSIPAGFDPRLLQYPQHGMGTNTLVVRRSTFERVGPFDSTMVPLDDSEWLLRAIDAGMHFVHLDEPLLRRRIHASNQSNLARDTPRLASLMARALHASLQRRRAVQ